MDKESDLAFGLRFDKERHADDFAGRLEAAQANVKAGPAPAASAVSRRRSSAGGGTGNASGGGVDPAAFAALVAQFEASQKRMALLEKRDALREGVVAALQKNVLGLQKAASQRADTTAELERRVDELEAELAKVGGGAGAEPEAVARLSSEQPQDEQHPSSPRAGSPPQNVKSGRRASQENFLKFYERKSPEGYTYFEHIDTGETTWELPEGAEVVV